MSNPEPQQRRAGRVLSSLLTTVVMAAASLYLLRSLAEAGTEMLSAVDRVDWGEGRVDIKLVAEWQLPH